jgi:hypothetical protein
MATELSEWHQHPPPAGAEPTRSWPLSLRQLSSRLIGDWFTAEIPEAISQADQSWISARLARLDAWASAGSTANELAPILAALFGVYPSGSMSDGAASIKVNGYLGVLKDRPAWAVRTAAEKWMRGEVGGDEARRFPPSAARLRDLATEEMSAIFKEHSQIQLMRRAKVVKPIEPAAVEARRKQVAELLGGTA